MLRDYQIEMKTRLMEAWKAHRSVMVQMPTGTGKTHLLASVVSEFVSSAGSGVWLIAHRRELVAQMEETLAKYGIRREDTPVRVMSVQWLSRHWNEAGDAPGLIVIDEAHHALAASYTEMWKRYPAAKKLGVTATPCRLNRRGFTELFEVLVTSWSIAEFIEKGVLSVFDYVSIRPGSEEQRLIDGLEKRGADGDYQVKEMDAVLNRRPGIERLYRSVRQFASGKKGMVYAISIEHARRIAEYYSRRGVNAVAVDSKTPAMERKRMVEEFRHGKIEVLVNVDVFSEGFDCPDVEFVQLARPTLSLAKYLQQVGRGLRRSEGKEACMLIDNVGLYRIFGLPARNHDWAAMFEGRMIGNALSRARAETGRLSVSGLLPEEERQREDELEVVITHDRLMDFLTNREDSATEKGGQPVLKSYYDRQSGLWGLRRGERMTVRPRYPEVFDICGDRAAVRFGNNRAGVVNETGQPGIQLDRCRKMKFMKGDLLAVTDCAGNESYIDLKVNRTYREKPVVLSFGCMELPYGGVELLKVGAFFFSRTGKPYVSMRGVDQNGIYFYDFYLKIPDYRVPKDCQLVDPVWTTLFDVFACVLAGDEEEVYWCCGRLADRSIVVMDGNGNYYHVEKGKEKRYIACNTPRPGEEDFHTVMERLKEEAGRRAGIAQRKQLQEEEQKRLKRLEEIRDALPFRMGMKWGLKLGERIIVPPKYRKILPPVGYYCAYEENACQWGIMALDGKVVVEARYQKVDIECNGTVHLTVIPGKVKTIKL